MLGSLETFGIEFKADEVAAGIEACDGGSARSHTTVKHQLSGIGVGFDQVFKQRQWLLGVVDGVGLGRYMQHAAGIAEAGILGNGSAEVPARVGIVAGLASALVPGVSPEFLSPPSQGSTPSVGWRGAFPAD